MRSVPQLIPPWTVLLFAGTIVAAHAAPGGGSTANVIATYTLPRVNLAEMGNADCSQAALKKARANGLKFADLPSIGSGLARVSEDEFFGITDRGPNGKVEDDDEGSRRTFPLPQFCPTIVRFKLVRKEIQIVEWIPLKESRGKLISGLSNVESDEALYESADARTPLPRDEDGVDPEGIRVFPNGRFLVCEEYGPSLLIVSAKGEVLIRYMPASKPLPKATYPVKAILPAVLTQRRANHGFESIALSSDGRVAYVILQSPLGDEHNKRFRESRVVRALKLDVSDPLDARVTGEYLILTSVARDYSRKQKQSKIYLSDAEWVGADKLLVIERGKDVAKVLLADFSGATNILADERARSLGFENVAADLDVLNVQPAKVTEIFSTREARGITSDKLEGLALTGPDEIALASDNDFGLGDANGEPSRVWKVRIPGLPALLR